MESTEVFRLFDEVSDQVWNLTATWEPFARRTLGEQLVRAADSTGANLVEGDARYSDADALHFFVIARASARETAFWIRKAERRNLLDTESSRSLLQAIETGSKLLNSLISYRRKTKNSGMVREPIATYDTLTPNA